MRPKGCEVDLRCCVHKERAVIRDRIVAGLGYAIEDDDECTLLSTYAKGATERQKPQEDILTVLQGACKGCVIKMPIVVTLASNSGKHRYHLHYNSSVSLRWKKKVLFILK